MLTSLSRCTRASRFIRPNRAILSVSGARLASARPLKALSNSQSTTSARPYHSSAVPNSEHAVRHIQTEKDKGSVLVLHTVYLSGLDAEADPYLVVSSGDWTYTSENYKDNPNPRWNCYYSFPFESVGKKIHVKVMEYNPILDIQEASFELDTDSLVSTVAPDIDAVRHGHFFIGPRKIDFFIDFKYQRWPDSFPTNNRLKIGNQGFRDSQLRRPEMFMRGVHFAISLQIEKWTPITCDSIPPPRLPKGQQAVTPELEDYFFVLKEDPDVPIPPEAGVLIHLLNQLPFNDENIFFQTIDEAIDYVHRVFGKIIIDPTEGKWSNLTDDDALSRFFFYNNGAIIMQRKPEGGYFVDLDWLFDFGMRDKYTRYGGAIHFDEAAKVTHIVYDGKTYHPPGPGEEHATWEWMKLVLRSSMFVAASGIHLMQGHLTWSNYPNYAMRTALSPEHPIRRLLHVHFWRSAMVCSKSLQSLIPEGGLLHRGTGFTKDGLWNFYKYALDTFKFETFPEELKRRGMDKAPLNVYPTAHDGMLFYDTIGKYVNDYIDLHYKSDDDCVEDAELVAFWDILSERLAQPSRTVPVEKSFPKLTLANLKTTLTEIIFRVTAWHQNVGNALAPINDPSCISLRLVKGQLIAPVQSVFVQGLVTMLTSMRMPTMAANGSWAQMFRGKAEMEVYNNFRDSLNGLSQHIIDANKTRKTNGHKIVDYDPRYTCVSVSS